MPRPTRTARIRPHHPVPLAIIAVALLAGSGAANAEDCPAAGARYRIKGFSGDTGVTATGGTADRTYGCKWITDDGRELWWKLGADVVPADAAATTGAANDAAAEVVLPAASGGVLAAGNVYECTLPGIGAFTGAYFGIIDEATYRAIDGGQGRYQFDATGGELQLLSGPSAGLRYRRTPEGSFRVLDEAGAVTGGHCVHNPAKSIDERW